jgi:hypothetical protein
MTNHAMPDASSVDDGKPSPPDWSGHWPDRGADGRPLPAVARSWFEAVMSKSARMRNVEAWRFTCPFCGERYQHVHHSEVYASAYRHLAVCDWVMDPLWTGVLE